MSVPRKPRKPRPPRLCFQFLIVLAGTRPLVWRRILVPATYSFWDLHVAIQDAMGWEDRHLHEFQVATAEPGPSLRIGIPDEELPEFPPLLPGWEVPIDKIFRATGQVARYWYDFGDDWMHAVIYEQFVTPKRDLKVPICLEGAGACPPEDCGGPPGYERLLEALANLKDPEHDEMLASVGGSFDHDAFDPAGVKFDDPRARWRTAFLEEDPEE